MAQKINRIIVCAYSVYPDQKSSEGIVNHNWIKILQSKVVINVLNSHQSFSVKGRQRRPAFLKNLFRWSKDRRKSLPGITLRMANKFTNIWGINIFQSLWHYYQYQAIVKDQSPCERTVYWARVLPALSLSPILTAYNKKSFPYIVNINDPLQLPEWNASTENYIIQPHEKLSVEDKLLLQTRESAQCWTFPSFGLARFISNKYGFDPDRCFVLPHAMPDKKSLFKDDHKPNKKIEIVYTGTFYKSAFSDRFLEELKTFSRTAQYQECNFTFVLGQYDESSLEWLMSALPKVTIFKNLTREQSVTIAEQADCILVTDAINHRDLLKGKLVEAISLGVPIFAVTYEKTLMDTLVKDYGGFVSYQDRADDISQKLLAAVSSLNDSDWRKKFIANRVKVQSKFSEENVIDKSIEIAHYALERYKWEKMGGNKSDQPIPSKNMQWP